LHFLAPYSLESIQRIIIIIKRMLVSKFWIINSNTNSVVFGKLEYDGLS
jgi:hypothetical protein